MTRTQPLQISVIFSPEELAAELRDRRPDSLTLFEDLNETARDQLALDAWTVGLRALANAHAAAQESKLKDVGVSLLTDIDRQLRAYVQQQQQTINAVLARFFDPNDGQVSQRLAAFVDDHGVLARLLDKYLGPQNSVLAEVLARQVGETSPLFRKLSPTESTGLVKVLEAQLRAVMGESHAALVRALDPLAEDGAVARFLKSLRDELRGADEDRQKQLSAALAALDANDEGSLLSRLVRETQRARQEVLAAVNPDAPASPMAILKASLTKLLQEQASTQLDFARRQEERQSLFEKEVREALARIETKRTQDQKTTRGGLDFEDAVLSFVRSAVQGAPCVFDLTGTAAGVFVMARSHASDVFPRFARCGHNVLVTWDDQDPATDAYLHAAILLGMGLVTRARTSGDAGDIAALRDIEVRIESELGRLERMEKCSDTIRKNVDSISDEVRKAHKALDLLLRKAQSTLRALNVEVSDETAEANSPIALPKGSFEAAVLALPSGNEAR